MVTIDKILKVMLNIFSSACGVFAGHLVFSTLYLNKRYLVNALVPV
jgi:hypothetical protein